MVKGQREFGIGNAEGSRLRPFDMLRASAVAKASAVVKTMARQDGATRRRDKTAPQGGLASEQWTEDRRRRTGGA